MNVPLLLLPYVTHPVNSAERQSGILIPVISNSSTKGIVLGEELYWAINRSMDLTAGAEYFSMRGWSPSATFRYRGIGNDFATARFHALFPDRGYYSNGAYINQGGQDVTFSGRHDLSSQTRLVADMEYSGAPTFYRRRRLPRTSTRQFRPISFRRRMECMKRTDIRLWWAATGTRD